MISKVALPTVAFASFIAFAPAAFATPVAVGGANPIGTSGSTSSGMHAMGHRKTSRMSMHRRTKMHTMKKM